MRLFPRLRNYVATLPDNPVYKRLAVDTRWPRTRRELLAGAGAALAGGFLIGSLLSLPVRRVGVDTLGGLFMAYLSLSIFTWAIVPGAIILVRPLLGREEFKLIRLTALNETVLADGLIAGIGFRMRWLVLGTALPYGVLVGFSYGLLLQPTIRDGTFWQQLVAGLLVVTLVAADLMARASAWMLALTIGVNEAANRRRRSVVEASLRELVRLLAALSGRTLFVGLLGFALVFPVVLFGPLIGLHIDNPWLVAGLTLYGLIVALTIGGMALAMFVGIANDDRSKLAAALAMETH